MNRRIWGGAAAALPIVVSLAGCDPVISMDRAKPRQPLVHLPPSQQAVATTATNGGAYYEVKARFDAADAQVNLLERCAQEHVSISFKKTQRTAVVFAGLQGADGAEPKREPIFAYNFDPDSSPPKCQKKEGDLKIVSRVLLENVNEDIRVSYAFKYVNLSNVPFGELANVVNGVNATFGGLPAVLTAPMVSKVGRNLEREVSNKYSVQLSDEAVFPMRMGEGRTSVTEFELPLVYKEDDNKPNRKVGSVVVTLVPLSTLSNAPINANGIPQFGDAYAIDAFPNIARPSDNANLMDRVAHWKNQFRLVDGMVAAQQLPTTADFCMQFAADLRRFNLNRYDLGYVLWYVMSEGLPNRFNKDPDYGYQNLSCIKGYGDSIRAAGIPLKTKNELIAEASTLAQKAKEDADRTAKAAELVAQAAPAAATKAETSAAYTQAAAAQDAAARAAKAAELGKVPAAREAAAVARDAMTNAIVQIKNSPIEEIKKIAASPAVRSGG